MATVTVPHNPELTKEQVNEAISRHFSGTFDVSMPWHSRWIQVKKSGWSAVGVQLKQSKTATTFKLWTYMPSIKFGQLTGTLLPYIIFRSRWKELEEDVATFIEGAPEFR